jgi:hypothetical protein
MSVKFELPQIVRKAAIIFARKVTGISRPVKEQRVHIEAFEECFDFMVKNGMVKEEFINVRDRRES